MNILFASGSSVYGNKPFGGAETSMQVLAEEFAALGNRVVYFTLGSSRFPYIKKKVIKNVNIYLFSTITIPSFQVYRVKRIKNLFNNWQKELILRYIIKKNNIEISYAFGNILYRIVNAKIKYNLNLKIVLRIAGISESNDAQTNKSVKQRKYNYLSKVDAFNFQSIWHKRSYLEIIKKNSRELPPKKVIICDIGIRSDFFRLNNYYKENKKKNKFVLICIMRFSARKRQDILLEAIKLLNNPNIELNFIGDGPNLVKIKNKINNYNLNLNIFMHGFLPVHRLIEMMLQSDLIVHAVDYEPQSKAVWEAMVLKKPVLASNVNTLNKFIIDMHNGFLVENKPYAWAKKIDMLYNKKSILEKIANNAFRSVLHKANPKENIITYQNAFEKIVFSND